ncbi:MAG: pilus assembly protein [Alphaproteobacteria bacterium]|nr:pilus assembly protein [Alphaproteobacteria bacterium]
MSRRHAQRGVAAVEFALTLSLWMILLLGILDGSYYLLINERVDRIAYTVTDIVTQYQTITKADLADIMEASGHLMKPLTFNPSDLGAQDPLTGNYTEATGYIIVTSVYQDPSLGPIVKWQYAYPPQGDGVTAPNSKIGTAVQDSSASLPEGLTLNNNDNLIVAEVFFSFSPLFVDNFLAQVIYRAAYYKPRLSPLITPPT